MRVQIRYMLAKFVFVKLGYPGWVGLSEHELKEKCDPFKFEVREHWKRLKRSRESMDSTLKPFVKTKWCDTAYFQAQDHVMALFELGKMHLVNFVSRMSVMGFVKSTCSRGGSVCKD